MLPLAWRRERRLPASKYSKKMLSVSPACIDPSVREILPQSLDEYVFHAETSALPSKGLRHGRCTTRLHGATQTRLLSYSSPYTGGAPCASLQAYAASQGPVSWHVSHHPPGRFAVSVFSLWVTRSRKRCTIVVTARGQSACALPVPLPFVDKS